MYEGLPNEEIHTSYQSFIYVCAIKFSYGNIVFVTKHYVFLYHSLLMCHFSHKKAGKPNLSVRFFLTNSALCSCISLFASYTNPLS